MLYAYIAMNHLFAVREEKYDVGFYTLEMNYLLGKCLLSFTNLPSKDCGSIDTDKI